MVIAIVRPEHRRRTPPGMTVTSPTKPGVSRRGLLGATASGAALLPALSYAEPPAQTIPAANDPRQKMVVTLTVNGLRNDLVLDTRTTLLDTLRRDLSLTGTKKGCDHGQCGACTVLVGGQRTLSCLQLAVMVREPVTTIEGLQAADGTLHPMQQAFIDQDAFQCGYCTPGQIMSAIACVQEGHARSDDDIREYMSGNLCRCAAYPHIVAAIKQAAPQIKGEG
jgi:xanthine dehydrogenase YagT iron-sulfur-binding subunit